MKSYSAVSSGLRTIGIGLMVAQLCVLATLLPLAAGVQALALIGAVIGASASMIGTVRLRTEHAGFRMAFLLLIVGFVLSFASFAGQDSAVLRTVVAVAQSVINAAAVYFICTAAAALLRDAGSERCAALGRLAWKIHLISLALSVVGQLAPGLPAAAGVVLTALSVLSTAPYITFLLRAHRELRQAMAKPEPEEAVLKDVLPVEAPEGKKEKKRSRGQTVVLLFILVAVIIAVVLLFKSCTSGVGKKGDTYDIYGGPVFPLTAFSGENDLQVERVTDFDFSPYGNVDRWERGSVEVTDTYRLTNTGAEDLSVMLAYPFRDNLRGQFGGIPSLTVDGERAGGGLVLATMDPSNQIFSAGSYTELAGLLQQGNCLRNSMPTAKTLEETMYVYRFSGLECDMPEVEGATYYCVSFSLGSADSLWYDASGGFSMVEEGRVTVAIYEEDETFLILSTGGPLKEIEVFANATGTVTPENRVEVIAYKMEELQTTVEEFLWEWAGSYEPDVDVPEEVRPYLQQVLFEGALERMPLYATTAEASYLRVLFSDVMSGVGLQYRTFEVTIPAGGSVSVEARFIRTPSYDRNGTADSRHGYDLATRLGSTLSFTEQSASISNAEYIEILRQNFGFDLEKGVTSVVLDPEEERYYMDVAPAKP